MSIYNASPESRGPGSKILDHIVKDKNLFAPYMP